MTIRKEEKQIQLYLPLIVRSLPRTSQLATCVFLSIDTSKTHCAVTIARDSAMGKPIAGANRHVPSVNRLATPKQTASNRSTASTATAAILHTFLNAILVSMKAWWLTKDALVGYSISPHNAPDLITSSFTLCEYQKGYIWNTIMYTGKGPSSAKNIEIMDPPHRLF